MLSPAERNTVVSGCSLRASSMVPAKATVLASIRPWKSLMSKMLRSIVAGVVVPDPAVTPTMTGSWSEER